MRQLWNHLRPHGWLVLDVKPSALPGQVGEPGQTAHGLDDWPDGSTIMTTSIWGQRENGRVLRLVTKYERFVAGNLVETEWFDYTERWYTQAKFLAVLWAAGFTDLHVTKAYDESAPTADDPFVVACRKP